MGMRTYCTLATACAAVLLASLGCNALLGTEAGGKGPSGPDDASDASTGSSGADDDDGDGEAKTDGGAEELPKKDAGDTTGPTGPGPLGALPFGYCCTGDDECRSRHCEAVGTGGKMCLDPCEAAEKCMRDEATFTCVGRTAAHAGWCEPSAPSFQCIPQASFVRGTKKTGECCEPLFNGRGGKECEGNNCGQWETSEGGGPWICTQWCDAKQKCPAGMLCMIDHICAPADFPYTCH